MMMLPKFYGRDEELAHLDELYTSPKSQFYPVYGRRRVGKTELILEFGRRHPPTIYFQGKEGAEDIQIREFMRVAARVLDQPVLEVASNGVSDWKTALQTVMPMRPKGKKTILVLDEFQWIAAASPVLPSVLQELWDREWKRSGDVFLILCGSYIGFMEKEVLGEKSPLFGRRTGQIFLQPFPYIEAAQFHQGLSCEDLAQTYFLCGGIPYYLEFFESKRSIRQNIEMNFLHKSGPLSREPDFLLREELREVENYYAILMAIATGSATAKEIAQRSGIPDRNLYYYLSNLTELRYVSRRFPITGKRSVARQVRFVIEDPLLRFWFRFVYPNGSLITTLGPKAAFDQLIAPELESYFGLCFERLCREALGNVYVSEGVNANSEIGEYWAKETQIDVLGRRDDGRIDIAECKWGKVRSLKGVIEEVDRKVALYPNQENLTVQKRLFLRKLPARASVPDDIIVHTLEEIYSLRS